MKTLRRGDQFSPIHSNSGAMVAKLFVWDFDGKQLELRSYGGVNTGDREPIVKTITLSELETHWRPVSKNPFGTIVHRYSEVLQ